MNLHKQAYSQTVLNLIESTLFYILSSEINHQIEREDRFHLIPSHCKFRMK